MVAAWRSSVGVLIGAVLLAACAAPFVLASCTRREPDLGTHDLEVEVRRLADEQRHAHDETLNRLLETNRALLEQERLRAGSELDGKKSLIDQQLVTMTGELDKVERARARRSKAASARPSASSATSCGASTKASPRCPSTPSSSARRSRARRSRGQWGERMAEDVLRLAGLLEGVNYRKQATLGNARPARLHVPDAERPRHAHGREVPARQLRAATSKRTTTLERKQFRDQFLRDVRDRVKELHDARLPRRDATRPSTACCCSSPTSRSTRSCRSTTGRSSTTRMRNKIVRVLTAHAVRGARGGAPGGRQLPARAHVERDPRRCSASSRCSGRSTSTQLDKVQQRFEQVAKEYSALMTTRHRALQRPLDKIEHLRHEERGLLDADIAPLTFPSRAADRAARSRGADRSVPPVAHVE